MNAKLWLLAAGLIASLAAGAWAAVLARDWTLRRLGTPEARTEWSDWKRDVERQQPTAVVQRRVPKSDEPPWLVLMRDHFAVMLVSGMACGALAFGFGVFVVHVIRSGSGASLATGRDSS